MKKPLEPYKNIKNDLFFWIKEYIISKILSIKVDKEFAYTYNRQEKADEVRNAKDFDNFKKITLFIKSNGQKNIGSYIYPINALFHFIDNNKKLTSIREFGTAVRDTMFIQANTKHTKNTQNAHLMQINSLFKFIEENNKEEYRFNLGRTRAGKKSKSPIQEDDGIYYLEPKELEYFIRQLDKFPFKAENPAKPKLMIKIAIFGGLRSEELASVGKDDIEIVDNPTNLLNGRFLRIYVNGKSTEERVIYIRECHIKEDYENYTKDISKCGGKLFFCTEAGEKYTTAAIYQLTKRLLDFAGFDKGQAGIHFLRRSYASYLATKDVDFAIISSLFGHASEEITELYMHISKEGLRNVTKRWKDF
ncbi:site-specific integrase [Aquamicrobium sp.]|uniref:tyrosine-type recombinase/integrase n=1 Tax=Aquamicrobium sp. TaxID=1872579 RepID=UPI002590B856|nr:site-specific integrase [Aquamicrobium sp.]MCK9553110.1 site-specific integrase [Aquamicrobium sp.]